SRRGNQAREPAERSRRTPRLRRTRIRRRGRAPPRRHTERYSENRRRRKSGNRGGGTRRATGAKGLGRESGSGWRGITAGQAAHSESAGIRSEEHTSELQSPYDLVCRLLLE